MADYAFGTTQQPWNEQLPPVGGMGPMQEPGVGAPTVKKNPSWWDYIPIPGAGGATLGDLGRGSQTAGTFAGDTGCSFTNLSPCFAPITRALQIVGVDILLGALLLLGLYLLFAPQVNATVVRAAKTAAE